MSFQQSSIPTCSSRQRTSCPSKRNDAYLFLIGCLLLTSTTHSLSPSASHNHNHNRQQRHGRTFQNRSPMKMSEAAISFSDFGGNSPLRKDVDASLSKVRERIMDSTTNTGIRRRNKKYKRQSIPPTEKEKRRLKLVRQAEYQEVVASAKAEGNPTPSIWSFECLFPDPVWDETCIKRDLYEIKDQDQKTREKTAAQPKSVRANAGPLLSSKDKDNGKQTTTTTAAGSAGGTAKSSNVMRFFGQPDLSQRTTTSKTSIGVVTAETDVDALGVLAAPPETKAQENATATVLAGGKVDRGLTRMVEDKMYGYRRTQAGQFQYETSLMGDGAIKFRNGVRLGNPLPVNADRFNYLAKKELQHGRIEEAKELYERAVQMDPRDGRAYLGLSRCAERRRDFKLARDWLRAGIQNSVARPGNSNVDAFPATLDIGGNPFLLQALGRLEEKRGHLSQAESLYVQAARSRPSHAAAWVSLAQLRTRKLGQTVASGRVCYETAERELQKAGLPGNAHVYTAWASLEYKGAGDVRRARQLFNSALEIDPKCSAAWLQLGVMEADQENWSAAQRCFETILKFDQRNSRALQAYALMETRRPEGSSRKAIDLFERALKVNPRDAGVLQPYALYVAELGDIDAARELLRRGTEVSKRHAPVWQAWGVMEMRNGNPEEARKIFQQGIWACAQLAGNQSGGYHCARLWQAWGVLESREGDYAAARRCFSRALDADSRNVATVTAWTQMEENLGNSKDARLLFERSLKNFSPGCDSKMTLWRSYELMEQRAGDVAAAQQVYQRSVRETFSVQDDHSFVIASANAAANKVKKNSDAPTPRKEREVEVSRWGDGSSSLKGEVWMNNGSIETKMPLKTSINKKATQNQM